MLIKVNKDDFDLWANDDISKKCFEPLIKIYKMGVEEQTNVLQYKEQFYSKLTDGQKALFMFYAFYNHVSKSMIEFYWWSAYFFAQPKSWAALKASFKYFEDHSMLTLLEEIETELKHHHHPETLEAFTVTREGLDKNIELQASFKSLYSSFGHIASLTICALNDYIIQNSQEFIKIEE